MQAVARLSSSSSFSKRVTVGISKEALKSKGTCKSYATSLKGQPAKLQKVSERIPKEEKRAAIASFVEKYRASNEGRFPPVSLVNKELGGSYYATRAIVQELEHKYKLVLAGQSNMAPPVDLKESSSGTSSESIKQKVAPTVAVAKKITTKRGQRSTIYKVEGVKNEEVSGTASDVSLDEQGHLLASTKAELPTETTVNTTTIIDKEQPSLKVKNVKEASKVETRTRPLQETPVEAETFKMSDEISKPDKVQEKQDSNEHSQYSTTEGNMWGNLKTFSDKIFNFWKKF